MLVLNRQQKRKENREHTMRDTKNPVARKYFSMYYDLHDSQDFDITDTSDRLRADTIRNAAKILHDATMKAEFE